MSLMTAAMSQGWSWTKGRENFHFTYFEKEKEKLTIGLQVIFIFYFELLYISQVFHNRYTLFHNQKEK